MAVNFNDSNYIFSGLPIGFSRNNPIPLDKTEVWDNLDNLRDYAQNNPTAYVGQILTYVDKLNKTTTTYVISNEDGDIKEIGAGGPTDGLESRLDAIDGILNGDTGLVTKVGSLETRLEAVTDSISSVFKYKGAKDSYSDLLLIDTPSTGDVWSVGEAEYAWNGTDWIELGVTTSVDLSDYAKKVDLETVQSDLNNLHNLIGQSSTGSDTPLFAAVEALQSRVDGIASTGGEANLINGISINGINIVPDETTKIVNLPIFEGSTSGLVPTVDNSLDGIYFLNNKGEWATPLDSRIGNLGSYATVTDYIDNSIGEALTWGKIADE